MTPGSIDQLASINSQIVQYLEVLLALAGVLALAYFALRLGLPRIFGLKVSASGPIEVLSRRVLEPKSTLYLIRIGSQMSLIATSESQVTFLADIAAENAEEVLASQRVSNTTPVCPGLPWQRKHEKQR